VQKPSLKDFIFFCLCKKSEKFLMAFVQTMASVLYPDQQAGHPASGYKGVNNPLS